MTTNINLQQKKEWNLTSVSVVWYAVHILLKEAGNRRKFLFTLCYITIDFLKNFTHGGIPSGLLNLHILLNYYSR